MRSWIPRKRRNAWNWRACSQSSCQLLPAAKFVAYRTELAQWQNQYVAELEKFLEQYPGYIEERRRDLNGTFDRSDYPDR